MRDYVLQVVGRHYCIYVYLAGWAYPDTPAIAPSSSWDLHFSPRVEIKALLQARSKAIYRFYIP